MSYKLKLRILGFKELTSKLIKSNSKLHNITREAVREVKFTLLITIHSLMLLWD